MGLTILADDLTGACDTGTLFTARGPVDVTVWPGTPPAADVRVIDTETRALDADAARHRVRRAAAAAPDTRYFKKVDSTLRGRVGAEVDALMSAARLEAALVCPAFPAQGRTVLDRVLLVHGRPVAERTVPREPGAPAPASSRAIDILRPQIDRPLAWIPLDHVRAGTPALAARLGRLKGTVAVADAETDADLDALVDAAFAADPSPLLVGSAGLAGALARRLGLLGAPVAAPRGRWLIVAGSRHPVTLGQVACARRAGLTVLTPGAAAGDPGQVAAALAAQARARLAAGGYDVVAVTGGDTALALYEALEACGIELLGAPAPGLALGRLRARLRDGLVLLTKAGGFGGPELFVDLARGTAA
jgi:uncharacterized protein YgbK (DUF1537 family)